MPLPINFLPFSQDFLFCRTGDRLVVIALNGVKNKRATSTPAIGFHQSGAPSKKA
jgi:hypothetical protein